MAKIMVVYFLLLPLYLCYEWHKKHVFSKYKQVLAFAKVRWLFVESWLKADVESSSIKLVRENIFL